MTEDLYQILGVEPKATQEEIRKRYLFLVQAYHPDRFPEGETRSNAEAELKKINGAYAVLGDPEKRKDYDRAHSPQSSSTTDEHAKNEFETKFEIFKIFLDNAMSRWRILVETSEESFIEQHKFLLRDIVTLFVYSTNLHATEINTSRDELKEKLFEVLSVISRISISFGIEIDANGLPKGLTQSDLSEFSFIFVQLRLKNIIEDFYGKGSGSVIVLDEVWKAISGDLGKLYFAGLAFGGELHSKPKEKPYHQQPSSSENARSEVSGICQGCGKFAPVCNVSFSQNIGALFVRFNKEFSGVLCTECIERIYWKTTATNLFLGWWGIISFFVNLVYLIANFFRYLGTFKFRRRTDSLAGIALGEKILVFGTIAVIAFFWIRPFFEIPQSEYDNATYKQTPTPYIDPIVIESQNTVLTPAPTRIVTPTPFYRVATKSYTNNVSGCTKWSDVRSSDKGKNLCVYGTVYSTVYGDDGYFYIKFSSTPNTFRMIYSKQWWEYLVQKGDCVKAYGDIKSLNGMLHLYYDALYKCD